MAAKLLQRVNHQQVEKITKSLHPSTTVRSDAYPYFNILSQHCEQQAKVTPPQQMPQWLPRVHLVIANLKRFLLSTFHGVSRLYLQEYVYEFVYRLNRRRWQSQLPQRLLNAAVNHARAVF